MRCENVSSPRCFTRRLKINPGFLHQLLYAFNREERGVSFIHVADGGANAERSECAVATDAEQNLLFDAHLFIAAVEIIGDVAEFIVTVFGDVGI